MQKAEDRLRRVQENSVKKQRYRLAWYLIVFWSLHFIASAFLAAAAYHPNAKMSVIINYAFVGAMIFLGGDEALRIFKKAKDLKESENEKANT